MAQADSDLMASRDLSFVDVKHAPRTLSSEQVEHYNARGYVKPFDIYNELEATENRAYFDWILAKMRAMDDGRGTYAINGYHTRCRGIYEMATHPRILDLVEDIVGSDIVCWGTHFFCKVPHDPKAVPWHQDASYWPLTPARTVTVWLAIDDADQENAAMQLIPETHRMGPLAWAQTDQPAVLGQEVVNAEQLGQPVSVSLRAGQASMHADMIVHGSTANRSDRRRCGLTIRYCPPTVTPLASAWASNAIICRGSDPTGRWADNPAPPGEDLSPQSKPKAIGGN